MGYFGQYCQTESELKEKNYNETSFETVQLLGNDVKLMWKFDDPKERNNIEAVVVAKTTNYVAIGKQD